MQIDKECSDKEVSGLSRVPNFPASTKRRTAEQQNGIRQKSKVDSNCR